MIITEDGVLNENEAIAVDDGPAGAGNHIEQENNPMIELEDGNNGENAPEEVRRRNKTPKVWAEFNTIHVKGVKKVECKHCNSKLAYHNTGSTTHMIRHLNSCTPRLANLCTNESGPEKKQKEIDEEAMQEVLE